MKQNKYVDAQEATDFTIYKSEMLAREPEMKVESTERGERYDALLNDCVKVELKKRNVSSTAYKDWYIYGNKLDYLRQQPGSLIAYMFDDCWYEFTVSEIPQNLAVTYSKCWSEARQAYIDTRNYVITAAMGERMEYLSTDNQKQA